MLAAKAVASPFILTLILVNFIAADAANDQRVHHHRNRHRRDGAFDLLRIETELELAEEVEQQRVEATAVAAAERSQRSRMVRRDEALNDEKCQKRCNEQMKSGLDMVKAHTAFGSVGVPSVIDALDLQMFCRLDAQHDSCLRECGYEVQMNMRDYVCKDRRSEMIVHLPCYTRAAPQLKRQCGAERCGPYDELELSVFGVGQRCRHLICDLGCFQSVLTEKCGKVNGVRALRFLVEYSRLQVYGWTKDISKSMEREVNDIMPPSCSRLFCERFDAKNCTSVTILQLSHGRV